MITLAFKRSWRVLVAYGAFTAWGLLCLLASALLILDAQAIPAIASTAFLTLLGIAGATVVGHLLGNLVALLRLRLWVVAVLALAVMVGLALAFATMGPMGGFLLVAALAGAGGYVGVASRLEIFAAWLPMTYAVGAAVMWMNSHGKVSVWLTGAKFAVWDAVTFAFLSGAVFLFLAFLMTRHALALTLWRDGARPGASTAGEDSRDSLLHAKAGRGSLGVLLTLTGVILVTTALLSPFLFRTEVVHGRTNGATTSSPHYTTTTSHHAPTYDAPAPSGTPTTAPYVAPSGAPTTPYVAPTTPYVAPTTPYVAPTTPSVAPTTAPTVAPTSATPSVAPAIAPPSPSVDAPIPDGTDVADNDANDAHNAIPQPDMDRAAKDGVAAAKLGLGVVAWLVVFLGLLLVLAVFFRPLRRAILLRHLERPLWHTTPTKRVENLWLLALVALDDVGVHVRNDETPEKLAARARAELVEKYREVPGGLDAAAKIVERVEYAGRGLSPDEEARMRAAVTALLGYVARHAGFFAKLMSSWSGVRVR